ncbi:MAG: hypothetical protein GY722_30045 [bacterium]|nr:hypothetical protein [bacterium]MCP4309504.1 hypothetical protein [bacterium]
MCTLWKVVFALLLFGIGAYLERLRRRHRKAQGAFDFVANPLGISLAFFALAIYMVYHLIFVPCG